MTAELWAEAAQPRDLTFGELHVPLAPPVCEQSGEEEEEEEED